MIISESDSYQLMIVSESDGYEFMIVSLDNKQWHFEAQNSDVSIFSLLFFCHLLYISIWE